MTQYRILPQGYRVVMGLLVPRGWPLERKDGDKWVYVDCLPPGMEAAEQYVTSVGGSLRIGAAS